MTLGAAPLGLWKIGASQFMLGYGHECKIVIPVSRAELPALVHSTP
jgi:hypothetical protein